MGCLSWVSLFRLFSFLSAMVISVAVARLVSVAYRVQRGLTPAHPAGTVPRDCHCGSPRGAARRDATPPAQHRPQTLVRPGLATAPAATQKSPMVVCGLLMREWACQYDR